MGQALPHRPMPDIGRASRDRFIMLAAMSHEPQYERLSMLSKKAGPLSLRMWLVLFLCGIIAVMYFGQSIPNISNGQYIRKLISEGTLKRTAGAFVRNVMPEEAARHDNPVAVKEHAKWTKIADSLAVCMQKNANVYLASDDPFLKQKLSKKSILLISRRLIKSCGTEQYLPSKKGK